MAEWHRVYESTAAAHAALGAGKPVQVIAGGRRICMALHNSRIYAIIDRCPHNGESLSKGKVNAFGEVICPWHGYRYSLIGGICGSGGPDAEIFPVRESDEGVFIAV